MHSIFILPKWTKYQFYFKNGTMKLSKLGRFYFEKSGQIGITTKELTPMITLFWAYYMKLGPWILIHCHQLVNPRPSFILLSSLSPRLFLCPAVGGAALSSICRENRGVQQISNVWMPHLQFMIGFGIVGGFSLPPGPSTLQLSQSISQHKSRMYFELNQLSSIYNHVTNAMSSHHCWHVV